MGCELDSTSSVHGSLMASLGFIIGWDFLDHLTNYQIFKKFSVAWREGESELVSVADKLTNN